MSAVNMPALTWDPELETVAQEYADRCVYGHNGNRTNDYIANGGTQYTYVGT